MKLYTNQEQNSRTARIAHIVRTRCVYVIVAEKERELCEVIAFVYIN